MKETTISEDDFKATKSIVWSDGCNCESNKNNVENNVQNPDGLPRCIIGIYSAGSLEGSDESEMNKPYGTGK